MKLFGMRPPQKHLNVTDTLNPIVIYATLTASCAIKRNDSRTDLAFSAGKWIFAIIALLLCILELVMIIGTADFSEAVSNTGEHQLKHATEPNQYDLS